METLKIPSKDEYEWEKIDLRNELDVLTRRSKVLRKVGKSAYVKVGVSCAGTMFNVVLIYKHRFSDDDSERWGIMCWEITRLYDRDASEWYHKHWYEPKLVRDKIYHFGIDFRELRDVACDVAWIFGGIDAPKSEVRDFLPEFLKVIKAKGHGKNDQGFSKFYVVDRAKTFRRAT